MMPWPFTDAGPLSIEQGAFRMMSAQDQDDTGLDTERRWGATGSSTAGDHRTASGGADPSAADEDLGHRPYTLKADLDVTIARLDAHEHHHATELNGFVEAVRQTLGELSAGVGGNEDLTWAVRGVRQIRAHLRRLDERIDRLSQPDPAGGHVPANGSASSAGSADTWARSRMHAGRVGALFDYAGYERTFRGDAATIQAAQVERYGDLVATAPGPVVDLGCGRGEFLHHLMGRGVEVVGVEPNESMADAAAAAGVPVRRCTATEYLESLPDRCLGAVISFQVVEHLAFDDILDLVRLASAKLVPGGMFIAETPNPASWIVMHSSFILDPTHRWPLHPGLLAFVCSSAGLEQVEVRYYAEADTLHLPQVTSAADPALAEQVNRAFAQLNHHLYGPQDYAVVAWSPQQ